MRLFDWFGRKPSVAAQHQTNSNLVAAIEVYTLSPSEHTRQNLQKAFLESTPLMALRTLTEGLREGPVVVAEDTPITVLTSTDEEEKTALLVFSDIGALRQ